MKTSRILKILLLGVLVAVSCRAEAVDDVSTARLIIDAIRENPNKPVDVWNGPPAAANPGNVAMYLVEHVSEFAGVQYQAARHRLVYTASDLFWQDVTKRRFPPETPFTQGRIKITWQDVPCAEPFMDRLMDIIRQDTDADFREIVVSKTVGSMLGHPFDGFPPDWVDKRYGKIIHEVAAMPGAGDDSVMAYWRLPSSDPEEVRRLAEPLKKKSWYIMGILAGYGDAECEDTLVNMIEKCADGNEFDSISVMLQFAGKRPRVVERILQQLGRMEIMRKSALSEYAKDQRYDAMWGMKLQKIFADEPTAPKRGKDETWLSFRDRFAAWYAKRPADAEAKRKPVANTKPTVSAALPGKPSPKQETLQPSVHETNNQSLWFVAICLLLAGAAFFVYRKSNRRR